MCFHRIYLNLLNVLICTLWYLEYVAAEQKRSIYIDFS